MTQSIVTDSIVTDSNGDGWRWDAFFPPGASGALPAAGGVYNVRQLDAGEPAGAVRVNACVAG